MVLLYENKSHMHHDELYEDENGEHHQVVGHDVERGDQWL